MADYPINYPGDDDAHLEAAGHRIAIIITGLTARLTTQRDQARAVATRLEQENAALADALRTLLRNMPEQPSTWAHETAARDHAEQVLADTMGADYLNGD